MERKEIEEWFNEVKEEYARQNRYIESQEKLTKDFMKGCARTTEAYRVLERVLYYDPETNKWSSPNNAPQLQETSECFR